MPAFLVGQFPYNDSSRRRPEDTRASVPSTVHRTSSIGQNCRSWASANLKEGGAAAERVIEENRPIAGD
jgi:hypothetical protein